ncbi:hypothetical protein C8R44DRAFT_865074 [Mycena epipterygia]|nr:hypothetical protein C8R44DRAFT_865074 [Mycena epipterygia]
MFCLVRGGWSAAVALARGAAGNPFLASSLRADGTARRRPPNRRQRSMISNLSLRCAFRLSRPSSLIILASLTMLVRRDEVKHIIPSMRLRIGGEAIPQAPAREGDSSASSHPRPLSPPFTAIVSAIVAHCRRHPTYPSRPSPCPAARLHVVIVLSLRSLDAIQGTDANAANTILAPRFDRKFRFPSRVPYVLYRHALNRPPMPTLHSYNTRPRRCLVSEKSTPRVLRARRVRRQYEYASNSPCVVRSCIISIDATIDSNNALLLVADTLTLPLTSAPHPPRSVDCARPPRFFSTRSRPTYDPFSY